MPTPSLSFDFETSKSSALHGSVLRCRVAVLISGRGSNMRALIEAARASDFPASVVLVVADGEVGGCVIARAAGVALEVVWYEDLGNRKAEEAIDRVLRAHEIELVCLAGFMRVLSVGFVARWRGRILNIHPSLLPELRGLDTHRRALEGGHVRHGCSVHVVTEEVDGGEVLGQEELAIEEDDSPETLSERVLALEHRLYPRVLAEYVRLLREKKQDLH